MTANSACAGLNHPVQRINAPLTRQVAYQMLRKAGYLCPPSLFVSSFYWPSTCALLKAEWYCRRKLNNSIRLQLDEIECCHSYLEIEREFMVCFKSLAQKPRLRRSRDRRVCTVHWCIHISSWHAKRVRNTTC